LQPHYNLIHREEYEHELQSICIKYGIGVIPYSPLARGFLTGKYTQAGSPPDDHEAIPERIKGYLSDPQNIAVMEQVRKMSQSYGVSATQLSLAWLLNNPSVTSPIIGPRSIDQLMENLASLQVNLASDDKQKLDVISAWQS
jgi:aryl-alcohol dehydrogenase-like predicted oxidoreductase